MDKLPKDQVTDSMYSNSFKHGRNKARVFEEEKSKNQRERSLEGSSNFKQDHDDESDIICTSKAWIVYWSNLVPKDEDITPKRKHSGMISAEESPNWVNDLPTFAKTREVDQSRRDK